MGKVKTLEVENVGRCPSLKNLASWLKKSK
jgi:hypothetical protein